MQEVLDNRYLSIDVGIVLKGLLNQPQFSGPDSGFSTALYLEFVKDIPVMPLYSAQREEQFFADFAIGKPPGDKV